MKPIKLGLSNFNVPIKFLIQDVKGVITKERDYKNMGLVMLFYIGLYGILSAFFALMLKSVVDTAAHGHTMLWSFFVMGVGFAVSVSLGVYVSQVTEKGKMEESGAHQAPKKSHVIDVDGSMEALQCV